jgi:2-keto-4-pentenoate hydratase/2-oxohepta-3-ene-1,7-dioic acid hydratase in catechol pathway
MFKIVRIDYSCAVELAPGQLMPIRQVFGIGQNYARHAKEMGSAPPERPVVFAKNVCSVIPSGEAIRVPTICQDREQVDYEGELAIVIGPRPVRDIPRERALDAVLGFAAANDISARWWQKTGSGGQFCRGKGFDTFCPLSDVTPTADVGDPSKLILRTRLNGQLMQESETSDMIFDVPTLVSELSRGTTLAPGTVILTGTPSGVGTARTPPIYLKHGDIVEVEITRLSTLRSPVVFESHAT